MDLAVYAHPWDLRHLQQLGGLARLRDLGFAEVAMATSYHAGRWLTPWSEDGMVRFLEDGTVHFRPREEYGALQPVPSSEVPSDGPSPLEELCAAAPKAGLLVRAWNVFFHNTRLGELHPESCVENCFGDRYRYALCPARPEVQQYGLAMLRDLGRHEGLHAVELEAFGWMGFKHSSHHEKNSFTLDPVSDWLLSVCFCDVCRREPLLAEVRPQFAALLRQRLSNGDAMVVQPKSKAGSGSQIAEALGPRPIGDRIVFQRRDLLLARLAEAHQVTGGRLVLAPQVHANPYFTGSQLPVPDLVTDSQSVPRDEVVLTEYGSGPEGIAKVLGALPHFDPPHQEVGAGKRLSIWPRAPQFTSDDDLVKVRELCREHAVTSIAVYHLGLLPWRTLERTARILTA